MPECISEKEIAAILQRIAHHDAAALRDLHRLMGNQLYSVLRHMLSTKDEADMAYLELIPRIRRMAAQHDPARMSARDWLISRAHLVAIEYLRARGGDQPFYGRNIGWHEDCDLSQNERDLRRGQVARINACLRDLPAQAAEMIVACFVYGLSYDDLAKLYDQPAHQIRTRIAAAGRQMKTRLMGAATA